MLAPLCHAFREVTVKLQQLHKNDNPRYLITTHRRNHLPYFSNVTVFTTDVGSIHELTSRSTIFRPEQLIILICFPS